MAKLRTFKSIKNDNYIVQFLVEDFSQNDRLLLEKFGEPTINVGGTFIGGAAATVNLSSNTVGSLTIDDSGNNYPSTPTITITGDGDGATATAVITNGRVTAINVTNAGSGYTYATATFSVPTDNFVLPDQYVKIRSGFPVIQSFDSTASPFSTNTLIKVNAYKDEIQYRWTEALTNLRTTTDNFSGEEVEEI